MLWRTFTMTGAMGRSCRPLLSFPHSALIRKFVPGGVPAPIIDVYVVSSPPSSACLKIRGYHVNPYTGREEKEADREHQRKLNQHGLKSDAADYSTTVMQRARERLNAAAAQRRERGRSRNRGGSNK
ncbi:hypothetical protein ACHAW6_005492 [Cyclotella cf. meneghiniana]